MSYSKVERDRQHGNCNVAQAPAQATQDIYAGILNRWQLAFV